MSRRLRLVFFGTPDFALPSLAALLDGRHEMAAVVTRPSRPRGRGQKLSKTPAAALAERAGVETLAPESPSDPAVGERMAELSPDLAVVVAYGRILPPSLLDRADLGFINAHASLLPALRGAAPVERAILAGLETTGVSIMQLDEGMDTGPVMLSRPHPIAAGSDSGRLAAELSKLSAELLVEAVDLVAGGDAVFTAQDEARAGYAPAVEKKEARIDWKAEAPAVERQVLAFSPAPGAFSFDRGHRVVINAASAVPGSGPPGQADTESNGELVVACGRGRLRIQRLRPAGRREMSAAEYLRGRRGALPFRFDEQD